MTLRALFSCVLCAAALPALAGCGPSFDEAIAFGGSSAVVLGPPRALPNGDIVAAGILMSDSPTFSASGAVIGRVLANGTPLWRPLAGEPWASDDQRLAVGSDGKIAFALQHGLNAVATTLVGVVDESGEIVWSKTIEGVTPRALDVDAAGNLVLGAWMKAPVTLDDADLTPEADNEPILAVVTPSGGTHLLFRAHDNNLVDVRALRVRPDGSGLFATNRGLSGQDIAGPVFAFNGAGEVTWGTSEVSSVVDIALAPGGGAFLLTGVLVTETIVELDAQGAIVRTIQVENLRVPPDYLLFRTLPRIDVNEQGEVLLSGALESGASVRDAYVAKLDAQGELAWEWQLHESTMLTLNASWLTSDTAAAMLEVEGSDRGATSVGGKEVPHRSFRDDMLVKFAVPAE